MDKEKIRTSLCSFGMSGRLFHAPFLDLHPGFELIGVWERTKKLAQQVYPQIRSYDSFDEMISDNSIDLVIVNTPNDTHYTFAKAALLANKHVVVEKPFTVDLHEAEDLISIANEKQLVLSVYHNRRWDSDFKTVRSMLASGVLGQIVEAEIHFDRYKPGLSNKLHKELPTAGNGVLYDLGSHLIDAALQLFGKPEAVFADLRIVRPGSQVCDYIDLLLYYKQLRVRLKSSYMTLERLPGYIIHGEHGSFIKSRTDVQEEALAEGKKPNTKDWGVEPEKEQGLLHVMKDGVAKRNVIPGEPGNYMEYYDGLYNAIKEKGAVPVKAKDGALVIGIIEAAMLSSNDKRVVFID